VKIVVIDGYLVHPDPSGWKEFFTLGECKIYERTPKELVIERCKDAEIILTNKVVFTSDVIEQLPKLKYIGVTATGYNNVDIEAARKRGIVVTRVPSYSTPSVAQHTFALLLQLSNQVGLHNSAVQGGEWEASPDFSFWKKPLIELDQMTMGIVGYGEIGQAVAKIALSFGLKVIVYSRSRKDPNVEYVDLKVLFERSDIISLHCALTEKTRHLINEKTLSLMKPNAILINTARGGLIDEKALGKALKGNKILGAAVDVLDKEPADSECPLLGLENCVITPHHAWASTSARGRLFATVLSNLKAFLAGTPQNVVM
jgi:glycerate dehydrogenase